MFNNMHKFTNKQYHTNIDIVSDKNEGIKERENMKKNKNLPDYRKILIYFDEENEYYVVIDNLNNTFNEKYYYSWDEVSMYLYDFV